MIGRQLSHFKILRQLGVGGMGEVYLAEDRKLERRVALKVLPGEVAADPERLSRLEREAKALAALDHPNIVTVFSIEEAEGIHFLTMAYVEGRTLAEAIPEQGLPLGELLALAATLADALCAAHEQGIVHRDLKPGNVMLAADGRLRVLDFGLAKIELSASGIEASQVETLTMTARGAVLGTYPYMSPEQAEGKPADARSDLFSLGIVLHEMATGVRPFQGDSPAALVSAILKDTPPRITELRPDLPERLATIVRRCLEKEPDDRYGTAEAIRDDLRTLQRDVQSGLASGRLPARGRDRSRALPLAAVLGIAVVAIAGTMLWNERPAPERTLEESAAVAGPRIDSVAVLPLRNLSGDPEERYFVDGMTEALITDLSRIGGLKVISRSSSMRFRDTDKAPSDIARELDVDALVDGSVQREGERVRVMARLVDPRTDRNLWSQRYERDLTSILTLQSEVAQAIAEEVLVTLTPEEERLLASASARQVVPAAYEAYMKGMFHWNELTPNDLETALAYFELALEKDPTFAAAHAGVARVWLGRQQMGIASPEEAMPRARTAASRALELDATLADPHSTLAALSAWGEWDWKTAEKEFQRAIDLAPSDPYALAYSSHVLLLLGQPEAAVARGARALAVDPFNALYKTLHGHVLASLGRCEEALILFEESLETVPGHPTALGGVWSCRYQRGELDLALEAARERFAVVHEDALAAAVAEGGAAGGYLEAMRRAADILDERPPSEFIPTLLAAAISMDVGRPDRALDWIQRGLEIRDPSLPYITVSSTFDDLRAEPAFQEAVRQMGLPG